MLSTASLTGRSLGSFSRQLKALFATIGRAFKTVSVAADVNYVQATGALTTVSPTLAAAGADANLDLKLAGKGTGVVSHGTFTGGGDTVSNGYITIKDAGGTLRKVMITA